MLAARISHNLMDLFRAVFSPIIGFCRYLGLLPQPTPDHSALWQKPWSDYLSQTVAFYRALSDTDRCTFEQRVLLFWQTTQIEGGVATVVDDHDKLLVAASAIIPVWQFPGWHYVNLKRVILLPASFNDNFECGQSDSAITGMVGTGPMFGKMALSKPALHQGFIIDRDKQNVGIHEFVHLVDGADGKIDGIPECLMEHSYALPWVALIQHKIKQIHRKRSNIRDYGATNEAEFFSVASEYFFERPAMLKRKHPKLYQALNTIYRQDTAAIKVEVRPRAKAPCPCGSGKRYKRCCMPQR
ncbi:Protein MtfA [BD1-7 clade bacterium]|uniref:Protein MtfA n=1 Tax=BD1-7 clade bacterium TaxID=2029982 RepID=A0A5S9NTI9_9GAMM|nr:Protein MtfA [BD1-7 clade bacterium]CAA0093914.1 Protein MtfA [BD1-7 clade bacterium]